MPEAALQRKPLPTRLRERFRIIQALVDFQKSRLYPILFALMCVISATNGMAVYIPIFWLMTVLVVFSILFTDDTKVLLVPMFLGYYAVGCDVPSSYYTWTPDSFGLLFTPFHQKGLTQMLVCGSVMVAAFLIRILLDGTVQKALKNRNLCFWGIIALSIVLFTNGIFHKSWQPINLFYGMFISIGLLLFYALLSPFWKNPQDMASYACHVLICSSGSVLLQILIAAIRAHCEGLLLQFDKSGQFSGIWRGAFVFSWGVTTIVGAVLVLGIPAALYLARNTRHPLPYLVCAVLFFSGSIFINTRSAMIVGGLVVVLGVALLCHKSQNARANRISAICLGLVSLCALAVVILRFGGLHKLLEILRFFDSTGSGRTEIWAHGLDDFKSAPIFGVGITGGSFTPYSNVFGNMYHSLPIQFLASTGIVGVAAFLFHFKDIVRLTLRRFSVDKFMLLLVPLMVLAMSLVDNFFFYLNFQIPYAIFLMLAERADRSPETT